MFTLRYLDVCLVLATAPFVLLGNLPIAGYLIGAGAWLLTRAEPATCRRARAASARPSCARGCRWPSMMGRVWLVALAIILARVDGGKDDGIMAAALLLAAFTVYFVMSFVTREGPLQGPAGAPGRARPS